MTVSVLPLLMPPVAAVMTTLVLTAGWVVFTVNVPVVVPAGTVIVGVAGLANAVLALVIVTTMSPGTAASSNTTVPVTECPPTTGFGARLIDTSPIGRTVNVAVLFTP